MEWDKNVPDTGAYSDEFVAEVTKYQRWRGEALEKILGISPKRQKGSH